MEVNSIIWTRAGLSLPSSVRFGAAWPSPARPSLARLGSAQLGSAWLSFTFQSGRFAYTRHVVFKNPATEVNCNVWTRMGVPRPGLARLGAAWPIPAQPGSARLGEGLFTSARVGETRSFAGPLICMYENKDLYIWRRLVYSVSRKVVQRAATDLFANRA